MSASGTVGNGRVFHAVTQAGHGVERPSARNAHYRGSFRSVGRAVGDVKRDEAREIDDSPRLSCPHPG